MTNCKNCYHYDWLHNRNKNECKSATLFYCWWGSEIEIFPMLAHKTKCKCERFEPE